MAYTVNPEFIGVYCSGESFENAVGKAAVLNSFSLWQIAGFTGPHAGKVQGIICSNNVSRKTAKVQVEGITKVRLGADVTAGDRLGFDANGDIIPDPSGSIGWAVESGTTGSLVSAFLNIIPPGVGGADGVVTSGTVVGTNLILSRSVGGDVIIDLSSISGGGGVQSERLCRTYTAGEAISALKFVYIDPVTETIFRADHTSLPSTCSVVGMTKNAVSAGGTVEVISEGYYTDPSLSFNTALDPTLFLSTAGNATQTPPTSGALQEVGRVTGPDSLYVDIQSPIILA